MKRILLVVETSRVYGRGIVTGISQFALEHGGWQIHFEDRGLLEGPSEWLRKWKGDGIISRAATEEVHRILKKKRCPIVELHGDNRNNRSEVQICDESIARMAAEHFMERGFRQFGVYSCFALWWTVARQEFFEARLRQHGFSCHIYSDTLIKKEQLHPTWENRFEKPLKKWLSTLPKPIGIWVSTDQQAIRVHGACVELGFQIPEDIAILGTSNDTLICNLLTPPLSSIDTNGATIGYEAARRLALKMEGRSPPKSVVLIPPLQVVVRQSTDVIAVPDPDFAAVLHYIRTHACTGLTVLQVCETMGLSRRSLERHFMKYLNRSPHDEIMRIRINQAKALLQGTALSLRAIAKKVGFCSREYFSSVFHREVGMSPNNYRNKKQRFLK